MTYLPGMMGFGLGDRPPTLRCDECGNELEVRPGRGGGPPAWLRNRKAPPGWKRIEVCGAVAHRCPACVAEAS